jgi:hypothetical protein
MAEQQPSRREDAGVDPDLRDWCARLVERVGATGLTVDVDEVLSLAGRAARAVQRPAAPLTTFVAGYAAGLAVGGGRATPEDAVRAASDAAVRLCREAPDQPEPAGP